MDRCLHTTLIRAYHPFLPANKKPFSSGERAGPVGGGGGVGALFDAMGFGMHGFAAAALSPTCGRQMGLAIVSRVRQNHVTPAVPKAAGTAVRRCHGGFSNGSAFSNWSEYDFTMTIDGRAAPASKTSAVVSPANGKELARCPVAEARHLDAAVEGAKEAFDSWRRTSLSERRLVMEEMANVMEANAEELGTLLSLENGKPLSEGVKEAGARTAASLRGFAAFDIPVEVLADTPQQRVELHRRPYGVVGYIIPFNFPLHTLFQKISPALFAGNSCVVKPSSATPLSTLRAMELLRDAVPPGLVQTLAGPSSLGEDICRHPGISKISFTGSTESGISVAENSLGNLKRLCLELGGNDAAIVLEDVNVEEIAEGLARAAFSNSGQVCHALKRLYVHDSIYEEMCEALSKECAKFKVGHPLDEGVDMGPLTTKGQFDYVCSLVEQAVSNGARVVCGGAPASVTGAGEGGFFYAPTVLADVEEGKHRIVDEEQFGPVLPVLRFSYPEDALDRANASEMGLTGSVWTADEVKGYDLASRLESGTAYVNHMSSSHSTTSSVNWPSQGYKMTGMGSNRGFLGLLEYTQPQTLNIRKL